MGKKVKSGFYIVDHVNTAYNNSIAFLTNNGKYYFIEGWRQEERQPNLDGEECDLYPICFRRLAKRELGRVGTQYNLVDLYTMMKSNFFNITKNKRRN